MKEIIWDMAARRFVREFSVEVRQEIGTLLMILQQGDILGPPQSKPMKSVHPSAYELRVKDGSGIYRVFYVFFDKDKILIPHAFTKKSQKTPVREIETAKNRLRRLIDETK